MRRENGGEDSYIVIPEARVSVRMNGRRGFDRQQMSEPRSAMIFCIYKQLKSRRLVSIKSSDHRFYGQAFKL